MTNVSVIENCQAGPDGLLIISVVNAPVSVEGYDP